VRVWIDLANSPHVPLFAPVVRHLEEEGHEVLLTARDHAQTLPLARERWPDVAVVGAASPTGRLPKAVALSARARELYDVARRSQPDVALSHGSYAQIVAARAARVPAVTMMDYEHQPANHLSFRLARRVVVPAAFPGEALRRCGARPGRVVRYDGFKEELYLGGDANGEARETLGLSPESIVAVLRPPPEGALYHRGGASRFDEVLAFLERDERVEIVLLPRGPEQRRRYAGRRVQMPERPLDGASLLASADLVVGGGGTMTREAALLGSPTWTVFASRLAAVDAELMRQGRLGDLRAGGYPVVARRTSVACPVPGRRQAICQTISATLRSAAGRRRAWPTRRATC
jgi:hypothetical protein